MYAKSFLALDGNGRLTGARTAQAAPYAPYTCHLCGSSLRYHLQYDTERPWFEHTDEGLTEHGHECPYVRPERREILLIKRLQQWVPDALSVHHSTLHLLSGQTKDSLVCRGGNGGRTSPQA